MKRHLLKILEIQHIRKGKVIWSAKDLLNTLHLEGEKFILSNMFNTTGGLSIPSFYYLGMDNRSTIQITDTMATIGSEPSGYGYSRQPVSSATGFTIENYTSDDVSHWRAKSNVITFSATGGTWGPVSNVFITDRLDNNGYLISTAPLGTTRSVAPSDEVTFRFAMNLVDQS